MPKQKKQPSSKPSTQQSQSQTKPPNWPPLRPLLPPTDLSLTPLLQDQIYLIHNFLPATLCKTYTSFLSSLPLTTTPGKPKKDEAVRVNDRFQVEDGRFAEMLWRETALRELVTTGLDRGEYDEDGIVDGLEEGDAARDELVRRTWGGEVLGLNPNIRIYRYSMGQFFAQHCMCPNAQIETGDTDKPHRRRIQFPYFPPCISHEIDTRSHDVDTPDLPDYLFWRRNSVLPRADTG